MDCLKDERHRISVCANKKGEGRNQTTWLPVLTTTSCGALTSLSRDLLLSKVEIVVELASWDYSDHQMR